MIWQGAIGLLGQVIGLFGERGKAKQEALKTVAANMQRTWVDAIIVLYWFAPTVLSWVGILKPLYSLETMDPQLMQVQLGISAAVFGLNKLAGRK